MLSSLQLSLFEAKNIVEPFTQRCFAFQVAIVGRRPNSQHIFNWEEDDRDKFKYQQFRGPFRLNGGNGLQRYRYKAQYDQQKQKRVQSASGDFMFGWSFKKWTNVLAAIQC